MVIDNPTPWVELHVGGTPLALATMNWINGVDLLQTCDGADTLTLTCNAWDSEKAAFRMLDERGLFPGNKVVLWSGYGPQDRGGSEPVCKGRFQIGTRAPQYTRQGVIVTLTGYDGLSRMMKNTQGRVFQGFTRDTEIIRAMVEKEYGWLTDVVRRPSTPPPNAPINAVFQGRLPIEEVMERPGDRVKPLTLTDLAWVKKMAEAYGYMYPKVKYLPDKKNEVFLFRPAASAPDEWSQTFYYVPPGTGGSGSILDFAPTFSVDDAPTGVEIMGWDKSNGKAYRVVATMTEAGPSVTWDNDQRVDDKVDPDIKSGGALRLSILGGGKSQVTIKKTTLGEVTWNPEKEVRDVLTATMVDAPDMVNQEVLQNMALTWLKARQSAWWTMRCEMENQAGLELLDSDQVHSFQGMTPMDCGYYILLSAQHTWSSGGKVHHVVCTGQKLIDGNELNKINVGGEVLE